MIEKQAQNNNILWWKMNKIILSFQERELSIPIPIYNGPSAFIPSSEVSF